MQDIVYRVETIRELHEITGFGKLEHPLVTVIDYSNVNVPITLETGSFVCGFY